MKEFENERSQCKKIAAKQFFEIVILMDVIELKLKRLVKIGIWLAMAFPIPLAEPVIRTILFSNVPFIRNSFFFNLHIAAGYFHTRCKNTKAFSLQ